MCKKDLPLSNFKSHHKTRDGLQYQCINCQKEYRKKHYEENKEKYIKKASKWNKDFRDWYLDFKSNLFCNRCGENHPACLQFHHLKDKDELISKIAQEKNKERLLKEVEKCEVLCANCHAKEHFYIDAK